METLFRGRFEIKTDEKGRLRIPTLLRTSRDHGLVITNNLFQGQKCLDLYTLTGWEKLEKRISKLPSLKAEVQAFQRFYMSGAQTLEFDTQGRILIPPTLRKYAGLTNEIVLVGMGEKIEIWNETVWERLYEGLAENFEETQQRVAQLDSEKKESST
jgi:MraZ protein